MPRPKSHSYYEVLTEAVNDILEHGYDSAERVAYWTNRLAQAAESATKPPPVMEQMLREAMIDIYRRLIEKGGIAATHPGISRFTLEHLKPQLRGELDRRILAAADLIKLNRQEAIRKTLHRFQAWSTSIPAGGTEAAARAKVKKEIRKSLGALPFEERRVLIDQGHKLIASINNVVAKGGGAIALEWRSNWRQANYNYREDHKDRDRKIYTMRPNWALDQGLMKVGPAGYYDQITAVGEEVFCRCYARYLYSLRALPADMITKKGREAMAEARKKMAA